MHGVPQAPEVLCNVLGAWRRQSRVDLEPTVRLLPKPRCLSRRAVLLGLAFVGLLAAITPYNDYYVQATFVAGNLLPTGSMVVLLLLACLVNPLLRRLRRRALSAGELATIWAMIIAASGIPAAGLWRYVFPQAVAARYFSSTANNWSALLVPYGSKWLTVQSDEAARWFYEGLPPGESLPWRLWALPLMTWVLIALAMYVCTACLVALLRRQWVEAERFTFPLVQLPLEVMREPGDGALFPSFFRQPLVWWGAAIPLVLHGLGGLATFFPAVPHLRLHYDFRQALAAPPWYAIADDTQVHLYPAVTGLSYLLSSEVGAGLWFAWVLDRVQRLFLQVYKVLPSQVALFELMTHESYGASLALVGIALWTARRHWRRVAACAVGRALAAEEESLTYRLACWGFTGGAGLLAVAFWLLGMPGWTTVPFLVGVFVMYTCVSWAATNGGMLLVTPRYWPMDLVLSAFGGGIFTPRQAVSTSLLEQALGRDPRENSMPSLLNGQKLAHELHLPRRALLVACLAGMVVATFVSMYFWLTLCHRFGGIRLGPLGTFTGHATTPPQRCTQWLQVGVAPRPLNLVAVGLGATLFGALQAGRLTFAWWPLHPIGLIMMRAMCLREFWFPIFLGWLIKLPIVRYGGLAAYNRARPFFLGLVLGDMLMAGVFFVVGLLTRTGYAVMPL